MHFVVSTANNLFYWQLLENNGTMLAEAPAPYTSEAAVVSDINLIKKWAGAANVTLPSQAVPKN